MTRRDNGVSTPLTDDGRVRRSAAALAIQARHFRELADRFGKPSRLTGEKAHADLEDAKTQLRSALAALEGVRWEVDGDA